MLLNKDKDSDMKEWIISVDPATKEGDLSCMIRATKNKDGRLTIKNIYYKELVSEK